ncbi:hypothetical protein C499_02943 [Halogeometricum borinquense DSM 11551]|uniref:Uncharacterized protein n=2 Tax=Halogeometricum borinquense TaxID=60847 RepID=E4NQJ1_HALBP|nr:hypothetical protein [Halogeometricum borinquense]ADQ66679.1 hypothetical protein Hbor_10890 [Halogeometricum borinquense DSM 11551]ELY30188.1 hypothetical protein C499_02943 [Halogeometricum borinquense DSM 11551]RYJ14525.1 hypothetical protein ELS19_11555 [Halogeometricum borinquense]
MTRHRFVARAFALCLAVIGVALLARGVAASNAAVGLGQASRDPLSVPRWLYVATGGATIGASALLASFVTDRRFVLRIHRWTRTFAAQETARRVGTGLLNALGIGLLALVVYRGVAGPQIPTVNLAVVVVFAGMRAGFTMFTYLVGDVWSALNPWQTVAARLPNGFVEYPQQLQRWPAVAGLLALVWIETTTGVTNRPALLASAVLGYSAVTVVGAVAFGTGPWFRNVDPVSVFFRLYGRVAPFSWDRGTLHAHLPGMRLVDDEYAEREYDDGKSDGSNRTDAHGNSDDHSNSGRVVTGMSDIAFVIALVWELTFSGFVTTQQGVSVVRALVNAGLPPLAVYGGLYLLGFAAFFGAYVLAARISASRLQTYREARELAICFAPPLLAIAAGYHLAHYFAFFLSLSPSLFAVLSAPFSSPANPLVFTLPSWVSMLNIAFVLGGHLLAIWIAHSTAYRLFPSRLQAIRSQYPFVLVMMGYTALSLWLISLPTGSPPFIS